jgi:hypothetical protein
MALLRIPQTHKIGNETMYNIEFKLPHIPDQLQLPIHSEVLSIGSRSDKLEKAAISHEAVAPRKPRKELTQKQGSRLTKMAQQNRIWVDVGEHFLEHTLKTLKENFFTKQGGKPQTQR